MAERISRLPVNTDGDKILIMAKPMTADDILPLIAELTVQERVRLIRLIAGQPDTDAKAVYSAMPPGRDEFSADEEPLSWDAEGWEEVG